MWLPPEEGNHYLEVVGLKHPSSTDLEEVAHVTVSEE
jgi:hypothetical protein